MYAGKWNRGWAFLGGYLALIAITTGMASSGSDFFPGILFIGYGVWSANDATVWIRESNRRQGHPSPMFRSIPQWALIIFGSVIAALILVIMVTATLL